MVVCEVDGYETVRSTAWSLKVVPVLPSWEYVTSVWEMVGDSISMSLIGVPVLRSLDRANCRTLPGSCVDDGLLIGRNFWIFDLDTISQDRCGMIFWVSSLLVRSRSLQAGTCTFLAGTSTSPAELLWSISKTSSLEVETLGKLWPVIVESLLRYFGSSDMGADSAGALFVVILMISGVGSSSWCVSGYRPDSYAKASVISLCSLLAEARRVAVASSWDFLCSWR